MYYAWHPPVQSSRKNPNCDCEGANRICYCALIPSQHWALCSFFNNSDGLSLTADVLCGMRCCRENLPSASAASGLSQYFTNCWHLSVSLGALSCGCSRWSYLRTKMPFFSSNASFKLKLTIRLCESAPLMATEFRKLMVHSTDFELWSSRKPDYPLEAQNLVC